MRAVILDELAERRPTDSDVIREEEEGRDSILILSESDALVSPSNEE